MCVRVLRGLTKKEEPCPTFVQTFLVMVLYLSVADWSMSPNCLPAFVWCVMQVSVYVCESVIYLIHSHIPYKQVRRIVLCKIVLINMVGSLLCQNVQLIFTKAPWVNQICGYSQTVRKVCNLHSAHVTCSKCLKSHSLMRNFFCISSHGSTKWKCYPDLQVYAKKSPPGRVPIKQGFHLLVLSLPAKLCWITAGDRMTDLTKLASVLIICILFDSFLLLYKKSNL